MGKRSLKKEELHIAIVGLGPSAEQFMNICKRLGSRKAYCDQVWAINALGDVLNADMIWHMDDVRVQEVRAAAKPKSNIAAMLKWLKTTTVPVMTSRAHRGYPALREFPLEEVLNHLRFDYFNSTCAYAVAYAIHVGATKISLFGCDFTYPNSHDAEKGRGCVEFWLGQAAARGIRIGLPKNTSLMDAINTRQERLYGNDTRTVELDVDDNGAIRVIYTEQAAPTAEEIEARYDHSKHPNALVEE